MKTFVLKAKLLRPYVEWERLFDVHEPVREAFGISLVYRGKVVDEDAILIVLQAESATSLDRLIEQESDYIERCGHDITSTEITVAESKP